MKTQVGSLASLSGLRSQHCHELCCRSQTWLGSHIIVAVVCRLGATALIRPLVWELPYAAGSALKSKRPDYSKLKNSITTTQSAKISNLDLLNFISYIVISQKNQLTCHGFVFNTPSINAQSATFTSTLCKQQFSSGRDRMNKMKQRKVIIKKCIWSPVYIQL